MWILTLCSRSSLNIRGPVSWGCGGGGVEEEGRAQVTPDKVLLKHFFFLFYSFGFPFFPADVLSLPLDGDKPWQWRWHSKDIQTAHCHCAVSTKMEAKKMCVCVCVGGGGSLFDQKYDNLVCLGVSYSTTGFLRIRSQYYFAGS